MVASYNWPLTQTINRMSRPVCPLVLSRSTATNTLTGQDMDSEALKDEEIMPDAVSIANT